MTNTIYTNVIRDFFPVDQVIPAKIISTPAEDSSSDIFSSYPSTRSAPQIWWLPLDFLITRESYPKYIHDSFIGILTDDEAKSMKEGLKLFKKRFNDDFARKNEILFGY